MRVCLINPPQVQHQKWGGRPRLFPPLGLAYIAAVLETEHEVNIIDANAEGWRSLRKIDDGLLFCGLSLNEIESRIKKCNPDIVGISIPFSIAKGIASQIAQIVKSIDKNVPVVVGGPHPSVRPTQTLQVPSIDYVVIGEGEHTVVELLDSVIEDTPLKKVKGIGYKHNGEICITESREPIQDIDGLPFPARHLLPMDEYFSAFKMGRASRLMYMSNERWTTMFTSRGCPFHCVFCSIHLTMGRKFRPRSPDNVVQEISHLIEKYQIKHINFEDDNMTLNKKRFERICNMIVDKNLDITWSAPNGIRADTLDQKLVYAMKRSGCKRVFVAPESGVQTVVTNIIKKNLDLKSVEHAVYLLNRTGIEVDASFVIGLPGETKEDIWKTIYYAVKLRKLGVKNTGFNIATPYYGTELY